MTFYHELRPKATQTAWFKLARKAPGDPVYDGYWTQIRQDLECGAVGDANSWPPWQIPKVAKVQDIRVLYLVRNGIQQLYSLATCSNVWGTYPLKSLAFNVWLRRLWQAMGCPGPEYDKRSRWERLCLLVQANSIMPGRLRAQGLDVKLLRLEDLTGDATRLRALAPGLSRRALRDWQRQDINRKVEGDRSPGALWAKWNKEQRETFRRMCGETMSTLGYTEV